MVKGNEYDGGVVVSVETGDIVTFEADVVALKFAQWLHGAEQVVARVLGWTNDDMANLIPVFGHKLRDTGGKIAARKVLFLSVPILSNYNLGEIEKFAFNALAILQDEMSDCRHLAMVLHSAGLEEAGLNESEAFEAKLAGIVEAFSNGRHPPGLERISIVDLDEQRVARLTAILKAYDLGPHLQPFAGRPDDAIKVGPIPKTALPKTPSVRVISPPPDLPQVYVLMQSSTELDDFFEFGISVPAKEAGFDCRRAELPKPRRVAGDDENTGTRLFELLRDVTDANDIRVICGYLKVNYDNLEGATLQLKQLALVEYLKRRSRLFDLAEWIRLNRPKVPTDRFPAINFTKQLVFKDIQAGIDHASVIVADMTDNDPVILFLVGYALGKGKETILILRGEVEDLPIDIGGLLRLPYLRIKDLNESLTEPLAELAKQLLSDAP